MSSIRETTAEVGGRIRRLREAQGLNQAELADRIQLSRSSVAKIEVGGQDLTMATLLEFVAVFGVTAGALLGTEPMPPLTAVPKVTIRRGAFTVECSHCGPVRAVATRTAAMVARDEHLAAPHCPTDRPATKEA